MEKGKGGRPAKVGTQPRTGVDIGRVTQQPERRPELDKLNIFIGRWMTEGETVAQADAPAVPIVASDIYQWLPGRHFVMHPAYGHIGGEDFGFSA